MRLRDYQSDITRQIQGSSTHDLIQLDTGGGKTPVLAAIAEQSALVLFIAHRTILIDQISRTLAGFGLDHGVIATEHTIRRCIGAHRRIGRMHVDRANGTRLVASIDSLIARHKRGRLTIDTAAPWRVLIDEAHHVLRANKWGRLADILPNARFIGCTATPCRLDGRSLHREKDGLFDRIVQAETLRDDSCRTLIRRGYLSDFRVYSIASNGDEGTLKFSKAIGDYTQQSMSIFVDGSTIVGDAVTHYRRLAEGRQAVAMCVTIRNAEELAAQFRADGIPATCVSSRLGAVEVARRIDAFVNREVKVLCNVDMVGEGFDVPGIEALIMCRKTASLVAYRQWIGRALRPAQNDAIIIDHVGNVITHGLPDRTIRWDIRRPPAGTSRINLVACPKCGHVHHGWLETCPECGEPIDLRPKGVGRAYVDLRFVDVELCEHKRACIRRDEQIVSETVPAPDVFGGAAVGQACRKLRDRMIEALASGGTAPAEINAFSHSQEAIRQSWWIQRFTLRDLHNGNEKFIREFKKWQSKSSAAMPRK